MKAVFANADGRGDIGNVRSKGKAARQALLREVLRPYQAAIDALSCMLVDDLLEMYPDVTVMLSL
jgi:hypothetical protein